MMTSVVLDGALGKHFGRNWELCIGSPAEALRIIDANKPGIFTWIKQNLAKYGRYKVLCQYHDGREEALDTDSFGFERKLKSVRFVPIIEGASAGARFVVGAVLAVVGYGSMFMGGGPAGSAVGNMGIAMMMGSVIEMLTPRPTVDKNETVNKTSHYFNGPVNTTQQGVPVPLIYGRVLVGSHAISANVTVNQI